MSRLAAAQTQAIRGAILAAALELHPRPILRSTIWFVVQELGITERELDSEIEYFRLRRWIETKNINVIGRNHLAINLTADGYDVAKGIDPNNPILVEA